MLGTFFKRDSGVVLGKKNSDEIPEWFCFCRISEQKCRKRPDGSSSEISWGETPEKTYHREISCAVPSGLSSAILEGFPSVISEWISSVISGISLEESLVKFLKKRMEFLKDLLWVSL